MLALVWALATVLGPIIAGIVIEISSWRWATATLIIPAILFAGLGLKILPRNDARPIEGSRWPIGRLSCLAAGCLALSMASEAGGGPMALAISAGAIAIIFVGLLADRRAKQGLFPRQLLSLNTKSVQGLGLLAAMLLVDAPAFLFTPYVVQIHFEMSALVAGQIATLTALGWSASAMLIARAPERWKPPLILAGPASLMVGLAGYSAALIWQSLPVLGVMLFTIGVGFGVSHGFISQRTIASAADGEADVTSGGIPTIEGLGSAVGAALAGVIASAAGFPSAEAGLRPFVVTTAFAAAMGLPALWLALKFLAPIPAATLRNTSKIPTLGD
jgi:MFS family permease